VRIARLRNLYATDCSRFRRMRRVSHEVFNPHASEEFQPLQEAEAVRLASELLENPNSWDESVKRSFAWILVGHDLN
jgi:cytochrome P450